MPQHCVQSKLLTLVQCAIHFTLINGLHAISSVRFENFTPDASTVIYAAILLSF